MSLPKTYQRKPQTVEAILFDASQGWDYALEIAQWCGGFASRDENSGQQDKTYYWVIHVETREGYRRLLPESWIVKKEDGYDIIPNQLFELLYEESA